MGSTTDYLFEIEELVRGANQNGKLDRWIEGLFEWVLFTHLFQKESQQATQYAVTQTTSLPEEGKRLQ